ncbi:uncharacterized protein ACLA_035040 [Aspergillus clavatus NRRL 1]|uniref:Uncharacterized protein n=1 Tax=Aspergillus clavatus (strain ATCC 1007 / CBS 513.65 / DSM 816 / NCTC 3887 / NRRL 1 / QM 1276 / 107) TaxID=344612 RepID=A1CJH7_ASPCL|nr:uncharacterized protein ACLA_035040 [Aspergillus clavatus NRRL 1]EAW09301.1 conserved hypothetical protein [Aspergillus clavatus NRRL 1]
MYFFPHASSPAFEPQKLWKRKSQSPRKDLFRTETGSLISCNNSSTGISIQTVDPKVIPIWLSVFFGNPSVPSPQLDHARFNAKASERVFELSHTLADSPSKASFRTSVSSRLSLPRSGLSDNAPVFQAMTSLCREFEDEILSCVTGSCTVCGQAPAQALVHRPLCATRYGYVELSDFVEVHQLVTTVASHTAHFTRRDEVDWSVGGVMSDRPYICLVAVPICSSGETCHQSATQMLQTYVERIRDGTIRPKELEEGDEALRKSHSQTSLSLISARSPKKYIPRTEAGNDRNIYLRSPSMAAGSPSTSVHTIGATVYIGRPSLQLSEAPRRGQLTCSVYASTWPGSVLPGVAMNEADDAIFYCRIAGFYEQYILDSADYRCAICSEVVSAESLVHRPLLFVRTNKTGLMNESERGLIKTLSQFVQGRWSYPQMTAVMGGTSDAHIFDFVVPICKSRTLCEEVARTAAREFIKLVLPRDIKLVFPGLEPDTDLSLMESEAVGEPAYKPETAEILLHKVGYESIMTDGKERDEDPMDCCLTITKLRHWYELSFEEEWAKRDYLREIKYKRTGDCSESESDDSDIDEDVVWVYARSDLEVASSHQSSARPSKRDTSKQEAAIRKLERISLFQPVFNLDFWLICEAMQRVGSSHQRESH